jgi:putative cardiolipin synthase
VGAAIGTPYEVALAGKIEELIETKEDVLTWSHFELVYDPPAKSHADWRGEGDSILSSLDAAVQRSESELFVVTPYFVPLKSGIEWFGELVDRGMNVVVVTNSLAANNHASVHSGYAPARKPLLKMGVDLYEIRPDFTLQGARYMGAKDSRATLHAKAFVVDDKELFLGTFNWDPRSANINTEMGIILESEELASAVRDGIAQVLPERAYRIVLNERGEVRWIGLGKNGEEVEYRTEPQTSWWTRFKVDFMRMLPIKAQL